MDAIKKTFEEPHGDRRQAIVFIGTDLKKDAIVASLDACLLTDTEVSSHQYGKGLYYDSLPPWTSHYDSVGMLSSVLRPEQVHKFSVGKDVVLHISNLALECPDFDDNDGIMNSLGSSSSSKVAVKVWLDMDVDVNKTNRGTSRLLGTLRYEKVEQFAVSIDVLADDDSAFQLRLEHMWAGQKRGRREPSDTGHGVVQVHVLGHVSPLHPDASSEDDPDEEHEQEEDAAASHQDGESGEDIEEIE